MNASELTARRGRVFGIETEFFYGEPVHLARDEVAHLHDATLKAHPTLVFGPEQTDAFPAAFEETVRECQ